MKAGWNFVWSRLTGWTLIGTSGNVGAALVSELAGALEAASKAGDLTAARRLVPELNAAITAASDVILAWLGERAGGREPVAAVGAAQ